MNIDKDIIGKPPNQAIVINDKLINRQLKEKEDHSKDNQVLSEPFTDTREQLEADVRESYEAGMPIKAKVLDWLDRQAAITKNECRKENRKRLGELHALPDEAAHEREELAWRVDYNGELVEKVKRERNELQAQVDSLTAELCRERKSREYAYNELNKMLALDGKRVKQINELTAERDHYRKHVNYLIDLIADIARKQPYTFDPEAPYSTLDTVGDYLDELHGNVASLTAERDELRDEIKHMQRVIDVQRDSFRKMEVELSKAKEVEQ